MGREIPVFIINGSGGAGKDTFVDTCNEILKANNIGTVINYSSVDEVKRMARLVGWDGRKDTRGRKLLSDLKAALTEYNNLPLESMKRIVATCRNCENMRQYADVQAVFFHIREPEEIEIAKQSFDAKTILITREQVNHITSNTSDKNVYDYSYDYVIDNSGTFDQLKEKALYFLLDHVWKENVNA